MSEASVRTEAESNGAEERIRTSTRLPGLDPEASASAIPPLPRVVRIPCRAGTFSIPDGLGQIDPASAAPPHEPSTGAATAAKSGAAFLVGRVEILGAERPHDPANGSEQLGIGRLELPQAAGVNLGTFPEADVALAGLPFADAAVRASYRQHVQPATRFADSPARLGRRDRRVFFPQPPSPLPDRLASNSVGGGARLTLARHARCP